VEQSTRSRATRELMQNYLFGQGQHTVAIAILATRVSPIGLSEQSTPLRSAHSNYCGTVQGQGQPTVVIVEKFTTRSRSVRCKYCGTVYAVKVSPTSLSEQSARGRGQLQNCLRGQRQPTVLEMFVFAIIVGQKTCSR
jgi:hypothetical protein